MIVPHAIVDVAREGSGELVVGFDAEAVAVGIDVELYVLVPAAQTSWVYGHASGHAKIGGCHTESGTGVCVEFCGDSLATHGVSGLEIVARQVTTQLQRELSFRTFHVECVKVGLVIVLHQHAIHLGAHHFALALG